MLICGTEFPDGDACKFIAAIRHSEIGANPFIPVIATTWDPTPELVRKIIDSGADDLVVKPISVGHLLERVQSLVYKRKPFVVTTDYVGPDRHRTPSRMAETALIDVPNPLKARITGEDRDSLGANAYRRGDRRDQSAQAPTLRGRYRIAREYRVAQIGGRQGRLGRKGYSWAPRGHRRTRSPSDGRYRTRTCLGTVRVLEPGGEESSRGRGRRQPQRRQIAEATFSGCSSWVRHLGSHDLGGARHIPDRRWTRRPRRDPARAPR